MSVLRGGEPGKLAKGYRIHDNPRDPIPQMIFLVRRPPLVRENGSREQPHQICQCGWVVCTLAVYVRSNRPCAVLASTASYLPSDLRISPA